MRPAQHPMHPGIRYGSMRRRLAQTTALAGLIAAAPAFAQADLPVPARPFVQAGLPPVLTEGATTVRGETRTTLTVDLVGPRTVLDWTSFNIAADKRVVFADALNLPGNAVLNRVVRSANGAPASRSQISGWLDSTPNVSVYLLNPQGVLFGAASQVNVGSLIVSTRGVVDDRLFSNFLLGGATNFSTDVNTASNDPTDGAVIVEDGAQLTALAPGGGTLALIGANVVVREGASGFLKAQGTDALGNATYGDIALVAADDTTINFDGSPLSITIAKGTSLPDEGLRSAIVARSALTGRTILLAAATRQGVNDGLLDVQATIQATSAYIGGNGIVLAAGAASPSSNVTITPGADTEGQMAVALGGVLTARGTSGTIDFSANGEIVAQPAVSPATTPIRATLDADSRVLVYSGSGRIVLGDVTSRLIDPGYGVDISAGGAIDIGVVTARALTTGGSGAYVVAGESPVRIASLGANGNTTISGLTVTISGSAQSDAGTLEVFSGSGGISAASLIAAGKLTANADVGDLTTGSATSQAGDVEIRAANVRGPSGGRATVGAGQAIDLVVSGTARLATAGAGGASVIRATDIDATALTAGGTLDARATGALTAGGTQSSGSTVLRAATSLGVAGTVRSTAGAIDVGTTAAAADIDLGGADAFGTATVQGGRDVTVGTLSAGIDATLVAGRAGTLRGGGVVGRDLLVTGADVRLGGIAGAIQQVGRTASYTATTGTITGTSANTGLTIRADFNPDTAVGGIRLSSARAIDLRGVALLTGDALDARTVGDVGIRQGVAGSALTLGRVEARALVATDANRPIDGAVTLGATRLRNSLTLSTPGAIGAESVSITAPGQALSLTSTGSGVTANGLLSATGGVTVSGRDAVLLRDVAGNGGAVSIVSTNLTTGAGAVSGASVVARANGLLTLGSATATGAAGTVSLTSVADGIRVTDATSAAGNVTISAPRTIQVGNVTSGGTILFQPSTLAATGTITALDVQAAQALTVSRNAAIDFRSATSVNGAVAITGTAVTLGALTAATAATLTATAPTGTISVSGASIAGGDLTFDARGAITLGNAESTSGTVVFRSGGLTATGAISANAVVANTDLIVNRGAGVTFDSATSRNGAVSLTAPGGTVRVRGDTLAATDVTVNAGVVRLNKVDATRGFVDLTASTGTLDAGVLTAATTIAAFANTDATITGASARDSYISLSTNGSLTVGGGLSAGTIVFASATNAVSLGNVSAGSDYAYLSSSTAGLTAADVTAGSYIFASAGADLALTSARASGGRVELSATRDIGVADAIVARDHVSVVAGGSARLGSVTDTGTALSTLRANGGLLSVSGATSVGGSLDARATGDVTMARVESTGGAVTLSSGGNLNAGAVRARQALSATGTAAGSRVTLASADAGGAVVLTGPGGIAVGGGTAGAGNVTSTGGNVTLASTGGTVVAGALQANGLVSVSAGADATLGAVTSDAGAVQLAASGALAAAAVRADGAVIANGRNGVTLASVRSVTSTVTLAAAQGPLTAGATQGRGNVGISAQGAIGLTNVVSDQGTVTVASSAGTVDAASLDGVNVDASSNGAMTLGAVTARGVGTNGTVRLVSGNAITVTSANTGTTFRASAGTTIAIADATVGTDAVVAARDIAFGRVRAGTLTATANGGTLSVDDGEVRGLTTLTKTGATGAISIGRLDAAGPTLIDSDGAVAADLLLGGATTIVADGSVGGRTGALVATVRSIDITAGGSATMGALTTTVGDAVVRAAGTTLLTAAVNAAGNLDASGAGVTLGVAGQTILQTAGGRIDVTSTSGAITGGSGLTLRSGSGDATLRSAGGITFQPGTLIAGGSNRQSAVRLAAGPAAPIVLDVVEARTIASPGTANRLAHSGPVSIVRASTRDTLDILLAGPAGPSLNVGTAVVLAGNLSLDAAGTLTTGVVNVAAGTTTLAGATVTSGAIATRALTATARSGAAVFSTIGASAGGITATAATDLRLTRADATGAILLTSAGGDIGGNTAPAIIAGGSTVTLRANDATRGAILLDTVSGAGGVDLFGRAITAEAIRSSAGGVIAATRRDAGGITDRAMTIGTIDAAGTIALSTGNRLAGGGATLALDRATSTGGNIGVAVADGDFAARTGSPRTILSAPNGTIGIDVGGATTLGSARGAAVAIAANSVDITDAAATAGALTLTARNGPLTIVTGSASGAGTLNASGALAADTLTFGTTLTATADTATIATLTTGGDAQVTGTTRVTIGSATTPATLTLTGRRIAVTGVQVGALAATAGAGGFDLRDGVVARTATIASDAGVTIGTLRANAATIAATGAFAADTLSIGQALTVSADTIGVTALTAGTLDADARTAFDLRVGTVARAARVTAGTTLTFGTLDAGSAALTAATDLTGDRLSTATTITARAGRNLTLATVAAGGDAALSAGGILGTGSATTPGALTLAGSTVRAATIDAGTLGVVAGPGGLDLTTTSVAGPATLTSGGDAVIGTLAAGTIDLRATGVLTADLLSARSGLTVAAASATVATTRVTGGSTRFAIGDGGLILTDLIAAGDVEESTTGVLTAGNAEVGGRLSATGATASFATTRVTGNAALTATTGDLRIGRATIGGAAALTAATDVRVDRIAAGGALGISAGGVASLVEARGGAAIGVTARTITIGMLATPAAITLTGQRIDATTIDGGTLTMRAGAAGADLRTTTLTGAADLASDAGLGIGTLTAASTRIAAAGALAADTLASRDRLDVSARSIQVARTTVSQGPAAWAATGGDLTLGSATIGGAATLAATGAASIDALDVAGDLLGSAAAIRIAATTVRTGNARLVATSDAIRLGTASIAGDTILTALGPVEADTLTVGRTLSAGGSAIALRRVDAAGTTTLAARGTALTLGEARFAADASLTAAGSLTADLLTVGTTLAARADTIALTSATIGSDATLTARDVTLGTFVTSRGALNLTTTGAAIADTLRVGGRLTANTAAFAARSMTVAGDAAQTGGTFVLGSAAIGGNARVDATGRASVDTFDVGGRLDANAATLVLNTAIVRGGGATLTATTAEIGQLTAANAVAITARGSLAATRLDAGSGIAVNAASATIGQAVARSGDVALATTGGDLRLATASASGAITLTSSGAAAVSGAATAGTTYRIDAASIALGTSGAVARQAGAEVTLVARTGTIAAQGSTTIAGTRAVSLSARGANGAIALAPETTVTSSAADVAFATSGAAALGTVTAAAGAIRLDAADAVLTRPVSAQAVTLTNVAATGVTRLGNAAIGNETEFAAAQTRFDLSNAEIGLVAAPTVTIASGARDVVVGAVGLGTTTGSTRFAITANGRIDMLGRFVATGSTASRTIAIGNEAAGSIPRTGVIRLAATQADGGRLLVDGAMLDLAADRIGGGLDRDFLDAIGYRANPGLGVDQVTREFVARPTSTLYNASALGAAPYSDGVLVQAGVLRLTYGSYALFQNTAPLGQQTGLVLGIAGQPGANGATLRLQTPGSTANTFALFGTIDGISSQAAALLGPERLSVGTGVSPVASRVNGCVIGSGGGCLNTNIAQPALNLFDTSRAEIVRTADDLTLPFDPLIGTNNEALYLDSVADAATPDCEGDKPCPTQR